MCLCVRIDHFYIQVNGRVVFEGILKIYWGLKKPITVLSERELMRRGSQRVESVMAAVEKVRARMKHRREESSQNRIAEEKVILIYICFRMCIMDECIRIHVLVHTI